MEYKRMSSGERCAAERLTAFPVRWRVWISVNTLAVAAMPHIAHELMSPIAARARLYSSLFFARIFAAAGYFAVASLVATASVCIFGLRSDVRERSV